MAVESKNMKKYNVNDPHLLVIPGDFVWSLNVVPVVDYFNTFSTCANSGQLNLMKHRPTPNSL